MSVHSTSSGNSGVSTSYVITFFRFVSSSAAVDVMNVWSQWSNCISWKRCMAEVKR